MAIHWSIESRDTEAFVVIVYDSEPPSLRGWFHAIEAITKDERYCPGMGFILDRRNVSAVASSNDVRNALGFIQDHTQLFAGSRWAVLQGNIASIGMARMGQIMGADLPIEVEIFEDLDAAKDWICSEKEQAKSI